MKHNLKKAMALILSGLMAISITACGKKDDKAQENKVDVVEATTEEVSESGADAELSKEEYTQKVKDLTAISGNVLTAVVNLTGKINKQELDQKSALEELDNIKALTKGYTDFAELTNPPEEYKDVHASLVKEAGDLSDATLAFLDALGKKFNNENTTDEEVTKIQNDYTSSMESLNNSAKEVIGEN